MPAFHKLPEALLFLRRGRGMTGKEVAAKAGISEAMFSGYQNGSKVPSLATLGKLLDALGSNLRELDRLLSWLAAGAPGEPPLRPRAASSRRGIWIEGHVVTGAEAEVVSQFFQAVNRLAELGEPEEAESSKPPPKPELEN